MTIKIDPADKYFSMWVRLRQGECQRCKSQVRLNDKGDPISHQASHFQGRRKEGTRYDPDNVDCLCTGCHMYFTANPAEHYQWQVDTKGVDVVNQIVLRSNTYTKKDRKLQAMIWKQAYKELKANLV